MKHAAASEIKGQLSIVKEDLVLSLEDNGKGFDVSNCKKSYKSVG